MSQNSHYNIILFSDDRGSHRQFSISKRMVRTLVFVSTALILGFSALFYFFLQGRTQKGALHKLQMENQSLKMANDRYLNATLEIEKKLKHFEEKTEQLAMYVGVQAPGMEMGGIGGAELFDNELGQYLRYDLSLLEKKTNWLTERFDQLNDSFSAHQDILDATPSVFPSHGWLSSGMGYRKDPFTGKKTWHNGIDISAPKGTPVFAPANGVVSFRGYKGGTGNTVVISHGNGLESKYAHLSRFNVTKGQRVKRGELIAYVGNSGRSTGPHLHFEIHKDDKAVNPLNYIITDMKR